MGYLSMEVRTEVLCGRICDLEAENAKLRERVTELEELLPDSGRWFSAETVEAIAAENAKLREEVNHLKKGDVLHVLTDQELAERQKHEREMQASVKALDDENVKLKADAERMFQANVEKNNEILGLLRDNAKLRELVRHLYECMCNIDMDGNHECDSCEYDNTDGLCDYERLMRELGVEVE